MLLDGLPVVCCNVGCGVVEGESDGSLDIRCEGLVLCVGSFLGHKVNDGLIQSSNAGHQENPSSIIHPFSSRLSGI